MGIRTRVMDFLGFGKPNPRVIRRAYNGAMVSRLTNDWLSTQASADSEIRNNLRRLRDRSREMVRNNPYARQAKRTTQINVIGTGIKLQSQVLQLRGNKRDNRINNEIEAKWGYWTRANSCDVAGRYSFHDFEWLAAGAMCEAGEALFASLGAPSANQRCRSRCKCLKATCWMSRIKALRRAKTMNGVMA